MSNSNVIDRERLVLTDRAVLQDAEQAMGNDPIRALVELITNCDDAYGDQSGRIVIELARPTAKSKDWTFTVRDRATGMNQNDMEARLFRPGARTSGFEEGEDVRGNLGRGAKDVSSFGTATFESIKNKRYTSCKIYRATHRKFIQTEREATDLDRDRLGIPNGKNGTVVMVEVLNGTSCPQISTLKRELTNHYQLRDIMQSDNREVLISQQGSKVDRTQFKWPQRELILEETVTPEGYDEAKIHLRIWRLEQRDDGTPKPVRRVSGVLLRGRRAIYENTFFSYESRAASRWFCGDCKISFIDELARRFDDNHETADPSNPIGIIRRDREGLHSKHPFYKALRDAVEPILKKLIEEEEKRNQQSSVKISQRLNRDLGQLGKDLARMFEEDTEETDEQLPPGQNSSAPKGPITVIPGKLVVYMGESKAASIRVADTVHANRIRMEATPPELISIREGNQAKLIEGKATIHIDPRQPGDGVVIIRAGDKTESAVFEVRPERPPATPPPLKLQFDQELYSVKQAKQRNLKLVAPESVVFEHGDQVTVSIHGNAIARIGGNLKLNANDDGFFECLIPLEGRASSGRVNVTAIVGDTNASTVAQISTPSIDRASSFHFEIENESAGSFRAEIRGTDVRIWGKHPAVEKLIGKAPDFPAQDEPIGRAAIAEIIASELTRKIVEAKYKGKESDAAAIYYEHRELLSKYLKKCQAILIPQ